MFTNLLNPNIKYFRPSAAWGNGNPYVHRVGTAALFLAGAAALVTFILTLPR